MDAPVRDLDQADGKQTGPAGGGAEEHLYARFTQQRARPCVKPGLLGGGCTAEIT